MELVEFHPGWESALQAFLQEIERNDGSRFFLPHPSDRQTLQKLASRTGRDIYCLMVEGQRVIGYGLLRGWDEGFDIPSLGVAIDARYRSGGLGAFLMSYLELMAARRAAKAVRLRVSKRNAAAISLYSARGYEWEPDSGNEELMVGIKRLEARVR